jgi:DUF1680 family protein
MNKVRFIFFSTLLLAAIALAGSAQNSLVNTQNSPFAKMQTLGISDVHFTNGFLAERFEVCKNTMLPELWKTYTSDSFCFSYKNFKVAAGLDTGRFRGPSFHDGDFYKTLEAVTAVYASTKDKKLEAWLDEAIAVIAKAQKQDGYIYTKSIIEQKKSGKAKMFDDQLSFEAYNFGHLMTAACLHYRATGKKTLLEVAQKSADFLIGFYKTATPEQARNAICPSHYMGLVELYRTTSEKKYLQLVNYLIDIRGTVEGTDDNSDRAPFRKMEKIVGHAVRANYLCAGVADVFAETGDKTLLTSLDKLWHNVTETKMYVTGGCGALYDGVSVDGTAYKPDTVQKIHQAYGRDFQLPNFSAHNETCANIGNMLWNWRMFLLTGESKYMDVLELSLYNSVMSGVSLDGSSYFYTNPLAASTNYPYHLRWEGGRVPYISKSNCCPPNLVRTIAELNNYMYTFNGDALFVNLYGANQLKSKFADGSVVAIDQITNYPWNGGVQLVVKEMAPGKKIYLRVPQWCTKYSVVCNGVDISKKTQTVNGYLVLDKGVAKGSVIAFNMDMPATLLEANPLVEENKNQVTVKRGPIVYCLESADLKNTNLFSVAIPSGIVFTPKSVLVGQTKMMGLEGTAKLLGTKNWNHNLYQPLTKTEAPIKITMIPYFAWANRGKTDMSVWLPVLK